MRKLILLVVALGLGFIGLCLVMGTQQQTSDQVIRDRKPMPEAIHPAEYREPAADKQLPRITYDTYKSQYGGLPKSLRDTAIPTAFLIDANGHLIPDTTLRRCFDYFFTTVGEEPIERIIERIQELLQTLLQEPALGEALAILDEYVALKQAEVDLQQQLGNDYKAGGKMTDIYERAPLLRELRMSNLSPEVYEAFFAAQDKREDYTLKKMDILKDKSLTTEERIADLKEIETLLPEHVQQRKAEEHAKELMHERVANAKAAGASDAEIFQLRSETVGPEAAERFAVADQNQSQWNQRIASYRDQRQSVLDSNLSEQDKQQQINALRQQHFSDSDLKRIPVIDRMMDAQ